MRLHVRGQAEKIVRAARSSIPCRSRDRLQLQGGEADGRHVHSMQPRRKRPRWRAADFGAAEADGFGAQVVFWLRPARCQTSSETRLRRSLAMMKGGSSRRIWSCVQLISNPSRSRFLDERRALDREFQSEHQAFAAHLADEIEFAPPAFRVQREVRAPRARTLSSRSSSSTIARNSSATAQTSGPPPNVEPCMPGRKRVRRIFSLAMNAPSGRPPARGFATVTISGKRIELLVSELRGRCAPGRTEFHRRSAPRHARGQCTRALPELFADG